MNFYKHHIGDYDSHTIHLTWSQDLVYRRLISAYYLRERPLPNDFPTLCRMVRATESTHKAALKFILSQFFELRVPVASAIGDATGDTVSGDTGAWHNSRCDKEIEQYQAQCTANRTNARSTNHISNRSTNGLPNQNQNQNQKETPLAPGKSNGKITLDPSGTWSGLDASHLDLWRKAFPAVNIQTELNKAAAWIVSNPKNKKTNYARFINNWLARNQDSAPRQQSTEKKFVI